MEGAPRTNVIGGERYCRQHWQPDGDEKERNDEHFIRARAGMATIDVPSNLENVEREAKCRKPAYPEHGDADALATDVEPAETGHEEYKADEKRWRPDQTS